MGVYIESRRGTGVCEFLAIDTESPYEDERPLVAAAPRQLIGKPFFIPSSPFPPKARGRWGFESRPGRRFR